MQQINTEKFAPADWVEHHARMTPDNCALHSVDSSEKRSWAELEERVARLAYGLRHELGILPGERIVTIMDGDIRSFELQFACMRAGIIMAPLNFRLTAAELGGLCRELEPALMVSDASWSAVADAVAADCKISGRLATAVGGGSELDRFIGTCARMPAQRNIDPNAVTHILFTSGTTGTPKGAMSTHSTLIWQALNQIQIARVAEEGTHVFTPAPVFHAGGLNSLSNPVLFFGGQVSIASRFDPEAVASYIGDPSNGVTHLAFATIMYRFISETRAFGDADFKRIRLALVAGAPVSEALRAAYHAKGINFSVQYGATETGPTVTALSPTAIDKLKEGSCGQAVMHVQVRLVNDGEDVEDGAAGEIWVKGPAITAGYWRRDPSSVFTDGWFRTGDVGRRDAAGYYYIVDRIKDMYKSGGENVSSTEVETVLLLHPSVAECAVIGVPDAKWGEVGLAIVRPKDGHSVSLDVLQKACEGRLARYKHPKHIEVVDNFPRNVTGKISKADLRKRFGRRAMGEYKRTPLIIVQRADQHRKDVYGSIDDAVVLQAQLMRGDASSATVLTAMHPIAAPSYLPFFSQLAREGRHVLACGTRYSTGDASLQMENVLLDLAASVRHAREHLGYRKIVLVGWSGGGSVMAGYQGEAVKRSIERTAAREITPLADMDLIPADGLLLVASHRSRHHLLTGQIDPSITNEREPDDREPSLDLYGSHRANSPPYDPRFIDRYRAAQIARNRKISAWVKDKLDSLRSAGKEDSEYCFTVHGTMADPRWLDPTLEPNGRRPNWTYLGDPSIVNDCPSALARYTSLRSWLSQWSYDDAQVDSVVAGPRIKIPTMVVTAGADDACPVSHTDAIFEAIGARDKQKHLIEGANHYFTGPQGRDHLRQAMGLIGPWLEERGFV